MRFNVDPSTRHDYARGTYTLMSSSGLMSTLSRGRAICADGRLRSFECTGYADSYFTVPARVTVRQGGKTYTVSGFVHFVDMHFTPIIESVDPYVAFTPSDCGKNKDLINGN